MQMQYIDLFSHRTVRLPSVVESHQHEAAVCSPAPAGHMWESGTLVPVIAMVIFKNICGPDLLPLEMKQGQTALVLLKGPPTQQPLREDLQTHSASSKIKKRECPQSSTGTSHAVKCTGINVGTPHSCCTLDGGFDIRMNRGRQCLALGTTDDDKTGGGDTHGFSWLSPSVQIGCTKSHNEISFVPQVTPM